MLSFNTPPKELMSIGHLPTSAYLRGDSHDTETPTTTMRKLRKAVDRSQDLIAEATTVFPFSLFPDTVTLDREKINIAHRFFFRVAETVSVRIDDILNVTADVGPLFGSLKIATRFFDARKPYCVNYLWRNDALRLKRLLQGYLIARKKNIDCSSLSIEQLRQGLGELGTAV